MWVLLLNNMMASQIEILTPIVRAETKEALQAYLDREKVECYRDGQWGKSFRQGGPLEWYNPPFDERESFVFVGTREDWAEQAAADWDAKVGALLSV